MSKARRISRFIGIESFKKYSEIQGIWLLNFLNRVDFCFGTVFFGSPLGFVAIASQTLRAASSNPLDSLRME